MGSRERKIEKLVRDAELAQLIEAIKTLSVTRKEDGTASEGIDISGFGKLKLALKREDDGVLVKLKVKDREPDATSDEDGDDDNGDDGASDSQKSYKKLKKRMKSDFKQIKAAVANGADPRADAVERFIVDCRKMVEFTGKGDEHCGAFIAACEEFRKSVQSGDMKLIGESVDKLSAMKHECHQKYR